LAQTGQFLDHELVWASPDTLVYPFDGTPNFVVRVVNQGTDRSPDRFSFQFSSPDYPNPGGGFATFPNGGYIQLAPAETTWVQAWSAGIYEHPAPQGFFERDITFRFLLDTGSGGQQAYDLTKRVTFENLGRPTPSEAYSGPMQVNVDVLNGFDMVRAKVRTPFSEWLNIPIQSAGDGVVTFATSLRERDDWLLFVESDNRLEQMVTLEPGATENIEITLEELPSNIPQFQLEKVIETPTGYWRGVVSESEGTFVAFPGQENWLRTGDAEADSTLMSNGLVQKYTFDGTLVWEHKPGWEIWGGDMSDDGRWVAYVVNPSHHSFRRPSTHRMVVLDGMTGEPVWTLDEPLYSPTGRLIESLELGMSEDGRYVAVGGTVGGQVGLFDVQAQALHWVVPEGQGWGQIRKLAFEGDYLYVGSGDNYLRKLRVSDGQVEWEAFIGGWPFVMGFDRQGAFLFTGTKSKNLTKIRDSDGQVIWQIETQNLDSYADPEGERVAVFGPQIYDAESGSIVGMALGATKHFLSGGAYIVSADRSVIVHSITGQHLSTSEPSGVGQGPGEQSQWSYLTQDEQRIIILGRDMGAPPQPGIAIYRQKVSGVSTDFVEEVPTRLRLSSAYPNPFSRRLRLDLETREAGLVTVSVHDILGRRVLHDTRYLSLAGSQTWIMEAGSLASGLYLIRISQGREVIHHKVVKTN
jgi:hypothetical protein